VSSAMKGSDCNLFSLSLFSMCVKREKVRGLWKKYILRKFKAYTLQLILQKGIKSKIMELAELVARIGLEKY